MGATETHYEYYLEEIWKLYIFRRRTYGGHR